ncbi:MAG: ADP-glyceromanno-heptose 6-epimerase [Bacteroidota bacterium]
MIIITGAAGFIGSCMTAYLNELGRTDLILVDDFSRPQKTANYQHKSYHALVDRQALWSWLDQSTVEVEAFIHLGARTDTTEKDWQIFERLNLTYSRRVWQWCVQQACPLIYASSAATYGDGQLGFRDDHDRLSQLAPLNPYGQSKQAFDLWALDQPHSPPWWAGLKFFNVYGPNEYHKGRMASVIFHAFHQIRQTAGLRLFRSHRADIPHGHQARDFIYVKDLVHIIDFLLKQQVQSGIYNVGTGQARSFLDLARALFVAMDVPESITFIDTPVDIRQTYQYFTQADMDKLRRAGYSSAFTSLELGVKNYLDEYLFAEKCW